MASRFTDEMKRCIDAQEGELSRQYAPLAFDAADVKSGRVETNYKVVLIRLLAAHALQEKLSAAGYARALETVADSQLRRTIKKNLAEEREHTRLVYRLLKELGIEEAEADRSMTLALRAPSFEAPCYFAERAEGELDLILASMSLDTTGYIMISSNYRQSSYAPHSYASKAILEDEEEHDTFAATELMDAAKRFGTDKVNQGLREWVPRAANVFGPPDSGFTVDCIRFGLKVQDNRQLSELYLATLEQRVRYAGLQMPRLSTSYPYTLA